MITWAEKPGLRDAVGASGIGLSFVEDHAGVLTISSTDDAAVQAIIDGYTLADALEYRKAEVDALVIKQFATGIKNRDGSTPTAAQMLDWPEKATQAKAWQAWANGGQLGIEPATPNIDAEITIKQPRSVRVGKVIAKAERLESLRAAINASAVQIKELLEDQADFAGQFAVDITAGWPV